jgi:hypothetical protein
MEKGKRFTDGHGPAQKVGDEVTSLKYPRSMNGKPRAYYLPRLSPEFYQGDAVVHWTLTVFDRATGWLNDGFHLNFREGMLHAAAREGLFCPAYCLMPDHIHLIWLGLKRETDQRNGGMAVLRGRYTRLSNPPSSGRKFLAIVLEIIPDCAFAGCRQS